MAIHLREKKVTINLAIELGLTEAEYKKILKILGRTPNYTEILIYALVWNKQRSYKNAFHLLKNLPQEGPNFLPNTEKENMNLVDLENGLGCVFKIDSCETSAKGHRNQETWCGLGKVNRYIYITGARPLAQLNSLRFGELTDNNAIKSFERVTKKIGNQNNTFGVPVVGGELSFHKAYQNNPVFNMLSAGVIEVENKESHTDSPIGNAIFLISSLTKRNEDQQANLFEKTLLEATLELSNNKVVEGIHNIGAEGILGACFNLSGIEELGMDIDLNQAQENQVLDSFEILTNDSQYGLLLSVKKENKDALKSILDKWDIAGIEIGIITEGNSLRYFAEKHLIAEIPLPSLVINKTDAIDSFETKEPTYFHEAKNFTIDQVEEPKDLVVVARKMIANPNLSSKKWVTEQHDNMVGTSNMSANCPSDASVINIKGTKKAIALTIDCNSRYVHADPEKGTAIAIAEAARNIICSGGEPSAISTCLNFGDINDPEVYWQFTQSVKGISVACNKFETPVADMSLNFGNFSVDENGKSSSIYPTPTIGMLGTLIDKSLQTSLDFKYKGDLIFMIGESKNDINSSEYLASIHGIENSPVPYFDMDQEYLVQDAVRQLIKNNYLNAAHDVSEGGIFITLFEMGAPRNLGFDIVTDSEVREDAFLFGESQSRIIVTVIDDYQDEFIDLTSQLGVEVTLLGHVTQGKMMVDDKHFGFIKDAKEIYETSLEDEILR